MSHPDVDSLEGRLLRYDRLLEVGIGRRTGLARRLVAAGRSVTALDISDIDAPTGVDFVRADVVTLDPGSLPPVDAVYARRLPPELHRPTARLASALRADLVFTTLGTEVPLIDASLEGGPGRTFYVRDWGESNRV
ncbi:MAG: UPF0146 family protein [Halobacteriota archaeon]